MDTAQVSEVAKKGKQKTSVNSYLDYTLTSVCQLHHYQQERRNGNVTRDYNLSKVCAFSKETPKPHTKAGACTSLQQSFQPSMILPSQPAVPLFCSGTRPWEPVCAGWHQSLLLECPQKGAVDASRSEFPPLHSPRSLEHFTQENSAQPALSLSANSMTTPSIFNNRSAS